MFDAMSSQAITPELREWIVAQAKAGCRPEDVLQSMRTSGWDEDTALDGKLRLHGSLQQTRFRADILDAVTFPTIRTVVVYSPTGTAQRLELVGEGQSFPR